MKPRFVGIDNAVLELVYGIESEVEFEAAWRHVLSKLPKSYLKTDLEKRIVGQYAEVENITYDEAKNVFLRHGLTAALAEAKRRGFRRLGKKWQKDAQGRKAKRIPRLWLSGKLTGNEKRWLRSGVDRFLIPAELTEASVATFIRWFEQEILRRAREVVHNYQAVLADSRPPARGAPLELDRADGWNEFTHACHRAFVRETDRRGSRAASGEGQRIGGLFELNHLADPEELGGAEGPTHTMADLATEAAAKLSVMLPPSLWRDIMPLINGLIESAAPDVSAKTKKEAAAALGLKTRRLDYVAKCIERDYPDAHTILLDLVAEVA